MARPKSVSDLATRIAQLLGERALHSKAIAAIEKTLSRVGAALGGGKRLGRPPGKRGRKPGRPPGRPPGKVGRPPGRRPGRPPGRPAGRRRSNYGESGEATILAFVTQHKKPTTQEIKKLWASQGRGGTADNALSKLVKEKKLKREPLEDQRGSRYLLP